jgi:hypothetical protein
MAGRRETDALNPVGSTADEDTTRKAGLEGKEAQQLQAGYAVEGADVGPAPGACPRDDVRLAVSADVAACDRDAAVNPAS